MSEKATTATTAATFVEIFKTDKQADGTLMVYGKATDDAIDSDQQICDPEWLKTAMPEWFRWGNIREQHSNIAAGKATEYEAKEDGHYITAHVVDANSVKKVESGVLKGFSIGIRAPRVIKDNKAIGGRIVDGQIVEVSLVDRPANPNCTLELAKAIDGNVTQVEELVEKRDVSTEERESLAGEGRAMPDGSFPIASVSDLKNAIQAFGRAKDPAAVRRHIIRRARALGATDLLPEGWTKEKAMNEESTMEESTEESTAVKAVDDEGTTEVTGSEESTVAKASEESTEGSMGGAEESTEGSLDTKMCKECGKSDAECKCAEGGYSASEKAAGEESSQAAGEESSQAVGEESSRPGGVAGVAGKSVDVDSLFESVQRIEKQLAILVDAHTDAIAKAQDTEGIAKAVTAVTERLSVVEKAASNGPARLAVHKPIEQPNENLVKAAAYREKAMSTPDQNLARGYSMLAEELEKSL